ncbi:ParB/RepB/Spo0J family partition protein [Massilia sp. RP-1-19]|uniref:ParB/RepB/Spo0J family partition protein n=1 Tax=Massilia polaris TaxID=2728846 RepID=A0A848HML7_9BURK|nr:ParB/RepB/Spo0J family partition protein [Massilia polaris]NML62247.1 ParB/RepB/Spo0J family partition protein [Massilia polaris]
MKITPTAAQSVVDAIADQIIADDGIYGKYELAKIRKSPDNRKRFNEQALQELAASIKSMGVAQPILIRPVTPTAEAPEEFEIVAGERRYRASVIAGMGTIPAMCRTLSDLDAAKIRILENLQREDPHPMEEAEGYQQLMLQHGFSADQLAEEVKKSRAYIYGRLKLCALTTDVREQFLNDQIPASTALLIARIPVPKLQVQALKEIATPQYGEALSYRRAVDHVQSRYMLNLAEARFPINDARLLASAGACSKCPKRTGNQPELYPDVKSADVCTDPDCHAEKRAAHDAATIVEANKKGIPILEGEAAQRVLNDRWTTTSELVTDEVGLQQFLRNAPHTKNAGSPKAYLTPETLPPVASYVKSADGSLKPFYKRVDLQSALEDAGACETVEAHAARMQALQGESGSANVDPKQAARDAAQQEHQAKEKIAADETTYRVELYKRVRRHGAQSGFSLQTLREVTKDAFREFSLPRSLSSIYEFDCKDEDAVNSHIDAAGLPEVQMILIDLLLGSPLEVHHYDVRDNVVDQDDFSTITAIAQHEGIDPVAVREELFPSPINVTDMHYADLAKFIVRAPGRINELKDIVIVHPRTELIQMLEDAAKSLGFVYAAGRFEKPSAPVAAENVGTAAEVVEVATPAAMGEGTAAAAEPEAAEPAPVVPAAKPTKAKPKGKAATPAPKPSAPAKTPVKAKATIKQATKPLAPEAAWPFPKPAAA